MTDTYHISVIIPAYNADEYLGDAIRSVLNQTTPAEEILVIDDGSTDSTAAVARSFGAAIRVLQQKNLGVASARNLGIQLATNPWLAFLDADDVMPSDRLEVQVQLLDANANLDIAMGHQDFFSGKRVPHPSPSVEKPNPQPALIPSALLCRATVFQRVGLFDCNRQGAEFIAWFHNATQLEIPYAVAEQTVVYRRIHGANLSTRQINNPDEYLRFIKDLLDRKRAN